MEKEIAEANDDSELFNKIVAFNHAKSKICFLNNCIEWNILLPSNDKIILISIFCFLQGYRCRTVI